MVIVDSGVFTGAAIVSNLNDSSASRQQASTAVQFWYKHSDVSGSDGKLHDARHSFTPVKLWTRMSLSSLTSQLLVVFIINNPINRSD